MDPAAAEEWLDRYVAAWLSYEPQAIGALFSEDVRYRYHPFDEPVVGRDAVVASWLDEADEEGASSRDAPGTYEASYAPVAVDRDVVVVTGSSRCRETPDGPFVKVYDNCFVIRFGDAGRCRELTEFYVKRP